MQLSRIKKMANSQRKGFTLVELLTVVAIITLLISILIPTLGRARESAKRTASRAVLKALGDGLDLFKNENPGECRGGDGYPASAWRDDPTIPGEDEGIYGAQWLVRYLLGKTQDGYIPRRNVPRSVLALGAEHYEEAGWYDYNTGFNPHAPLDRVGPYIPQDRVEVRRLGELENSPYDPPDPNNPTNLVEDQPVFVDNFEFPILYYAANTRLQKKMKGEAPIAGIDDPVYNPEFDVASSGIYSYLDNKLFTGAEDVDASYTPWDFTGMGPNVLQKLSRFGAWTGGSPTDPADFDVVDNEFTFPNYILNKDVFDSTDGNGIVPYRPDSFILITPGPDGIYGNGDDVTNF